jgi:protein-tyrosine-phosphatase
MALFVSVSDPPALDVLVVCTGNFTRSPYITWELRRRVNDRLTVGSAGTAAVRSSFGADPRMLECLRQGGVAARALRHHRPRQVTQTLVNRAALVVTATREIRGVIDSIAPGTTDRVYTLLELAELLRTSPACAGSGVSELVRAVAALRTRALLADETTDLHDPLGKAPEAYQAMMTRAAAALDVVVPALLTAVSPDRASEPC